MTTMPTFGNGKAGCATAGRVQPGPIATSHMVTTVPPTNDATAPQVLNRFQNRVKRMAGKLADAAITNATPATSAATLAVAPTLAAGQLESRPTRAAVMRATSTCSPSLTVPWNKLVRTTLT